MTVDDYKKATRTWKSQSMNFRGNLENKDFIEAFRKDNGLESQGEALDFIIGNFALSQKKAKELSTQLSTCESERLKLSQELQALQEKANKVSNQELSLDIVCSPTSNYLTLKDNLEHALPGLFNIEATWIKVTDQELLELMVDYCERDPSKEFPFQPIAEKIVANWKEKNQQP